MENLEIIPSNINLSGAEIELISMENKEYLLKNNLDAIKNDYDFIIIDCPPIFKSFNSKCHGGIRYCVGSYTM